MPEKLITIIMPSSSQWLSVSLSVCVSVCLCLSVCLSLSLSLTHTHTHTHTITHSLTEPFSVNWSLLSPLLFLMAVDWIMRRTMEVYNLGLQWTPWSQLDDLDFADDIALVSHHHQQIYAAENHTTGQHISQTWTKRKQR